MNLDETTKDVVLFNIKAYINNAKQVLAEHSPEMTNTERVGFARLQSTLENMLKMYNHETANVNKLVRYIAVQENKDFEDVIKEFEI